jgi:hypothetical protein
MKERLRFLQCPRFLRQLSLLLVKDRQAAMSLLLVVSFHVVPEKLPTAVQCWPIADLGASCLGPAFESVSTSNIVVVFVVDFPASPSPSSDFDTGTRVPIACRGLGKSQSSSR